MNVCLLFAWIQALADPNSPLPQNEVMQPSHPTNLTTYEPSFWRMILTLIGIVVLLLLTLWLFRRIGRGRFGGKFGGGTAIVVLERRMLSQKSALYLVEIGDKRVLVSESQVNVQHLATLGSEATEPEPAKKINHRAP